MQIFLSIIITLHPTSCISKQNCLSSNENNKSPHVTSINMVAKHKIQKMCDNKEASFSLSKSDNVKLKLIYIIDIIILLFQIDFVHQIQQFI